MVAKPRFGRAARSAGVSVMPSRGRSLQTVLLVRGARGGVKPSQDPLSVHSFAELISWLRLVSPARSHAHSVLHKLVAHGLTPYIGCLGRERQDRARRIAQAFSRFSKVHCRVLQNATWHGFQASCSASHRVALPTSGAQLRNPEFYSH
jgi:hypothetical protein